MTHDPSRSISSDQSSSHSVFQSEAMSHSAQKPEFALEIQALQILESSDDCIKVLDLEGRVLFINSRGQALLGIEDVTPFLQTAWVEFWQRENQQTVFEVLAKAKTGEVCTFQGCCPTLSGEPKWWDSKISPMRGENGQIEQLLCISHDITERKQIEGLQQQAKQKFQESEERYLAIINQAVTGIACTDLDGKLTLVNQKYCGITGYSEAELRQRYISDITHPEDLPRNAELFNRMRTEGTPFEIEKRYIRRDGSIVWVCNSVYVVCDRDGKPQSAVAIVLDISERKKTEAALRASAEQFRLFTAASSDIVYKMSADWQELRLLNDKNLLASTQHSSKTWFEQYIPVEQQPQVIAAIASAIQTKSTFELEHRVIQLDGTIGWMFSRAMPLLNEQGEIVEWLGAASDITARKQAELHAELLTRVTQSLAEVTCVEDIIQAVGKLLSRYLQVSNCALIEINESTNEATIKHCWHQEEMPIKLGTYQLSEFTSEELFQQHELRQTIIVRDVTTDPRIADSNHFTARKIGSFINVPLIRETEWKFTLSIYHQTPYTWHDAEVELVHELANRIWATLERTRVETALRQNQEMFAALVANAPFGVYMIDSEFRFQQANQTAVAVFNIHPLIGQDLAEALRTIWQEPFASEAIGCFRHTLATGEPYYSPPIVEPRADIAEVQSYDWQIHRINLPNGSYGVVCYFYDLSEIKRAEEIIRRNANQDAFLVTLNDALRPLTDSIEIQATANRVLGEYLGASRVTYFEVRGANYIVEQDYVNGVESLQGGYPIESFGAELLAIYRRGHTATSTNVATDPHLSPAQRAAYTAIQIAAYIGVPLVKQGEFVAGLAVHSEHPRNWTSEEIALTEEVAERTWAAAERTCAETALRESEAKYRSLFNSIDQGFCIIEVLFDETGQAVDYCFLEANPAFEKQTGLVNAIGKTVRELVPQHEAYWFEIYGEIALTGDPKRFEKAAKGIGRFYDVYAFRMGKPQERKVAVLFNDISDRKRIEAERERLFNSKQHYANQLQGLTHAALAINSALSVEDVLNVITHQASAIVGTHQAVTSLTINHNWAQATTTIYLSDKYAQWRDYDEAPDGSGIYACVCHLNRPLRMTQAELESHPQWKNFGKAADKHPPLRGWLAAPLVGRDGQNIGLIQLSDKYTGEFTAADEAILVQLAQMASVAIENARLYEAEQQARAVAEAAREEAQMANRVKDEFLAVLSHELRSPLNPILGWAKLLQSRKLDAAKTAQALATIERNAKLQSELIEDLLDVSRILRGKLSLNVTQVNLGPVIRSAMETVRLAAEAKAIQVEADFAPDVGLVSGDSTRLQQVVWNLLSNAVKFTPTGGRVKVRLEQIEEERVNPKHERVNQAREESLDEETGAQAERHDSRPSPSYAQITVSDNGKGIPANFLPYVFDYFRQEDGATTRKFGGLGVGLAIVRHLVELHGGKVTVASDGEGLGATFTVKLPLLQRKKEGDMGQQGSHQRRSHSSPLPLMGLHILVIDDETDSRDFVAFVLEQAGAKVTTAATAREGLVALTQSPPDVLVSDVGMPDIDGYMLMQQVKALPPEQGGQVKAIALTAYAGDFNQQRALQAGFQHHLSKPVEPEVLVKTIRLLSLDPGLAE